MDNLNAVLSRCSLFDGIPEERYPNVLRCLQARFQTFEKDTSLVNIGDESLFAGIVLSGVIQISLLDENGNQITVDQLCSGNVFGADMACSLSEVSPTRMQAVTDCDVVFLDFSALMDVNAPPCPFRSRVAANLMRDFARQTLFLNHRLRIIAQKRLRDKIKVFLQYQRTQPDGMIFVPFSRSELAEYLYVDRSALSRELSRMCEDGLISCQGHSIRILDSEFMCV